MEQPVFSNPPIPTTSSERSPLLDILRSFALFGILFINMEDFAAPPTAHWVGWWNVAAKWFLRFAGEGKFRSVYALLYRLYNFLLRLRLRVVWQSWPSGADWLNNLALHHTNPTEQLVAPPFPIWTH